MNPAHMDVRRRQQKQEVSLPVKRPCEANFFATFFLRWKKVDPKHKNYYKAKSKWRASAAAASSNIERIANEIRKYYVDKL